MMIPIATKTSWDQGYLGFPADLSTQTISTYLRHPGTQTIPLVRNGKSRMVDEFSKEVINDRFQPKFIPSNEQVGEKRSRKYYVQLTHIPFSYRIVGLFPS